MDVFKSNSRSAAKKKKIKKKNAANALFLVVHSQNILAP